MAYHIINALLIAVSCGLIIGFIQGYSATFVAENARIGNCTHLITTDACTWAGDDVIGNGCVWDEVANTCNFTNPGQCNAQLTLGECQRRDVCMWSMEQGRCIHRVGRSNTYVATLASGPYFGAIGGGVIAAKSIPYFGVRRMILFFGGVSSLATGLGMAGWASSLPDFRYGVMLAFRIVSGVAMGGLLVLAPLYIADMSPRAWFSRTGAHMPKDATGRVSGEARPRMRSDEYTAPTEAMLDGAPTLADSEIRYVDADTTDLGSRRGTGVTLPGDYYGPDAEDRDDEDESTEDTDTVRTDEAGRPTSLRNATSPYAAAAYSSAPYSAASHLTPGVVMVLVFSSSIALGAFLCTLVSFVLRPVEIDSDGNVPRNQRTYQFKEIMELQYVHLTMAGLSILVMAAACTVDDSHYDSTEWTATGTTAETQRLLRRRDGAEGGDGGERGSAYCGASAARLEEDEAFLREQMEGLPGARRAGSVPAAVSGLGSGSPFRNRGHSGGSYMDRNGTAGRRDSVVDTPQLVPWLVYDEGVGQGASAAGYAVNVDGADVAANASGNTPRFITLGRVAVYLFAAVMQASGVPATLNVAPLVWGATDPRDDFAANFELFGTCFGFSLLAIPLAWKLHNVKLQYYISIVVAAIGLTMVAAAARVAGDMPMPPSSSSLINGTSAALMYLTSGNAPPPHRPPMGLIVTVISGLHLLMLAYFAGLAPAYTLMLTQSDLFRLEERAKALAIANTLQSSLTVAVTYFLAVSVSNLNTYNPDLDNIKNESTLYSTVMFVLGGIMVLLAVILALVLRKLEAQVVMRRRNRTLFE